MTQIANEGNVTKNLSAMVSSEKYIDHHGYKSTPQHGFHNKKNFLNNLNEYREIHEHDKKREPFHEKNKSIKTTMKLGENESIISNRPSIPRDDSVLDNNYKNRNKIVKTEITNQKNLKQ